MSNHKDLQNPNAFPGTDARGFCSIGMSLRDYFAGQCIVGMASEANEQDWYKKLATRAYRIADAMLAERMKDNG